MSMMVLAVFIAVALFAFGALVIILIAGGRSPTEVRLAELGALPSEKNASFNGLMRGAASVVLLPLKPLRNWLQSNDEDLLERLSVAGYRRPEDAETFLTCKVLFPVIGVLLSTFFGTQNIIIYGMVLAGAGFFAPDAFIFWATSKRKDRLNLALPDAVDLLVICIEAGLGLDQAVLRVAEELRAPCPELAEELLIISREQRAGKPRIEAWRSMSNRVDLDAIRQFVAMLVQTEKLGTPIARALGTFADGMRTQRLLRAEENAAKTTIKLVFPLVFFIFPAIFVVLLGPAAITLMQGLQQAGK